MIEISAKTFREIKTGGERGIRTLDTFERIHDFQSCSFGHSDISPGKTSATTLCISD